MFPERIVIINDASTARGGATGLAMFSAKLLRELGYPITYICGDNTADSALRELDVEIVSIEQRQLVKENKLKAFSRGVFNSAALRMVGDWIERNDTPATIYHVHGWSKILSPSIFRALDRVARRTVIHAHDFFLVCPNGAFMDYQSDIPCERVPLSVSCITTNCDKRNYAQKVWRVAREGALRMTLGGKTPWASFVTIHNSMDAFLEKGGLPRERIVTIRNPSEPLSLGRVRVENNTKMLFIGRVEAEKGIEEAISAAAASAVPLKVIGDGPLREKLTALHPNVEFMGWRSREEISRLVVDARFLVMPSRYPEPFGLVAAEASQSGIPVLLAETAFLSKEVVAHGIGLSCNVRDKNQFAAAVAVLRDMPSDEIRIMSERAFEGGAGLSNSPETWINDLLGIYSKALRKENEIGSFRQ